MAQPDDTVALHPLHTPTFVAEHVMSTGRLPGMRATGRSTCLALEYVAKAMRTPFVPVPLVDHFDSTTAHTCLKEAVVEILSRLDFRGFSITRNHERRPGVWQLNFGVR